MDGEMEIKSNKHLLIHTTYNLKNSKVSLLVVLKTECVLGVSKKNPPQYRVLNT